MWLGCGNNIDKGCRLKERESEELVDELTAFMAYCCTVRGNNEGTMMGKLQAVTFYHEQWVGLSRPLGHFRVKAVRQGIQKVHTKVGNQPKSWRSLTWELVKDLEGCAIN